ncbi:MAG: hypothetical protein AB1631_09210 [Acidobacteriota bacterium]
MRKAVLFFLILLLIIPFSVSASGLKLEPIGALADPAASEAVRVALEDKGYRVLMADGSIICELWLRKALQVSSKKDVSGAVYTEIPDSTLIGVISFPKGGGDFRGQAIKAGAYTLRYSLHPVDGNHLGISPVRDFLVMVPLADDKEADAQYKFEDLMKLSSKASGTAHPAPLSLVTYEGKVEPTLSENEYGHVTFSIKMKTSSGGELPVSFIVKGKAEQ